MQHPRSTILQFPLAATHGIIVQVVVQGVVYGVGQGVETVLEYHAHYLHFTFLLLYTLAGVCLPSRWAAVL